MSALVSFFSYFNFLRVWWIFLFLFLSNSSWGATDTWTGSSNNNYNAAANWSNGTVPNHADFALFTGTAGNDFSVTLSADKILDSLIFDSTALEAYDFSGSGSIEFDRSTTNYGLSLSARDQSFGLPILLGNGNVDFNIEEFRTLTLTEALGKDGGSNRGLDFLGNGSIYLSKVSTFDGDADFNKGALIMGIDNAINSSQSSIDFNNATLDLNGYDTNATALNISGDGLYDSGVIVNKGSSTSTVSSNLILDWDAEIGGDGDIIFEGDISTRNNNSGRELDIIGGGTFTFKGTNNNDNTGSSNAQTIGHARGAIVWDYTSNNTDKVSVNSPLKYRLQMNDSSLKLIGNNSSSTTQTINELDFERGSNYLEVQSGTNQNTTFALNSLAITGLSTLDIQLTNSGSGSASVTTDRNNNSNNGILDGRITYGKNTWAVNSTNGSDGAITGLSDVDFENVSDENFNWQKHFTVDGDYTFSTNRDISTLRFHDNASRTITINSGRSLKISNSGILVTPNVGSNDITINGDGRLRTGASGQVVVHQHNPSGSLTIASKLNNSAMDFVKAGEGDVILSNSANDYTGRTIIHGGTLSFSSIGNINGGVSALGNPSDLFEGEIQLGHNATAKYTGSGHSTDRTFEILGNSTIDASGSGNLTLNGYIVSDDNSMFAGSNLILSGTGNGVMNNNILLGEGAMLTKSGSGTWTLAGKNLYGDTTVAAGKLIVNGTQSNLTETSYLNTIGVSGDAVITNIPSTSGLSVGDPVSGDLIHSISYIQSVDNSSQITLRDDRNNGSGTTADLYIKRYSPSGLGKITINSGATLEGSTTSLANNTAFVNNGTFILNQDKNGNLSEEISGTGALIKDGNGTVTLSRSNSMNGLTTVQRDGAASGNSSLTLSNSRASNKTLQGDIKIKANASLDLGLSNQIKDDKILYLDGGSFNLNGYSEGSASSIGIGTLNLLQSSTIDLGGGTSILTFNTDSRTGGILTIKNWNGNLANTTSERFGNQMIIKSSGSSNIGLGNIQFADWGNATAAITGDLGGGFYEIIPDITITSWNVDANGSWETSSNWNPASPPDGAGEVVLLDKSLTAGRTITLGSNKTIGNLQITGGGSGNDYTLTGATIIMDVSSGNAVISSTGSNASTIASNLSLSDSLNVINDSSGTLLLSGVISGSQAVHLNGSGNVKLTANNTYSGNTFLNNGTLTLTGQVLGNIDVDYGGMIAGGNGTNAVSTGDINLLNAKVSPGEGNGAGQIKFGDATSDSASWTEGTYVWNVSSGLAGSGSNSSNGGGDSINEASGTSGSDWDLINFTGSLDFSGASENSIKIQIKSNSNFPGYNSSFTQWNEVKIIQANNIIGFNKSFFELDSSGFNDAIGSWWYNWDIAHHDNALWLQYRAVPEPSTYATCAGLLLLLILRLYRKKSLKNKQ